MYGLISKDSLDEIIINVTKTLGNGSNNNAHLLLSETANAETSYGDTPDLHFTSGYGVFQFDLPGFNDTINRTSKKRKELIKRVYNIDLEQVDIIALQWSPLLSCVMARLFYLLRPGAIPNTMQGRGEYWKKWYNTELGKGTVKHYIDANKRPRFI